MIDDFHIKQHYRNICNNFLDFSINTPNHQNYLKSIKEKYNFYPNVIYDIGAHLLTWSRLANNIWPDSKIIAFEAMDNVEFLYKEHNFEYSIGVFSDEDDKEVIFYQSNISPGGNSYYKEISWASDIYFGKDSERIVKTTTIDTIVKQKNYPLPDMIKIDVQGSELDILKGMKNSLKNCKHIIVELQHINYNHGAPLNTESIPFIESLGYKLESGLFCNNGSDGDYHFKKIE